jgi:hypothetical protein
MNMKTWMVCALAAVGIAAAEAPARAEDAALQQAQCGALLAYVDTELKVLFTNVSGREFDLDLARSVVGEMKRAIPDAKKAADRSGMLLSESQAKLKPEVEALRNAIKGAEDQLAKLEAELDKQATAAGKSGDDDGDDDKDDKSGAKKLGNLDWEPLKAAIGWLYADVSTARGQQDKLGKKLSTSLRVPARPKGKRDE